METGSIEETEKKRFFGYEPDYFQYRLFRREQIVDSMRSDALHAIALSLIGAATLTILTHFVLHRRIAGSLPHAAAPWNERAIHHLLPGQARDEAQRTEIGGDRQRLVTVDAATAQAFVVRRQVEGW